jgi:UDP-2,3-diacylglucosamine hydrolase
MRKVFIADAHLREPTDENYRLMLEFLSTLPGSADTLFILGDLFEFWIGYKDIPFPHYLPILEKLRDIHDHGVSIVYLEGNHDFHMGPFFEETLHATIHTGPTRFNLDGKELYLCHGDEINSRDYSYRLLRMLFHSGFTKALTHVVPPAVPIFIADRLGRKSRSRHGERKLKWDYPSLIRSFAADRFAEGCDVMITGHFHVPFTETTGNRLLVSLGDWITHFSYAEWENGKFELKSYR